MYKLFPFLRIPYTRAFWQTCHHVFTRYAGRNTIHMERFDIVVNNNMINDISISWTHFTLATLHLYTLSLKNSLLRWCRARTRAKGWEMLSAPLTLPINNMWLGARKYHSGCLNRKSNDNCGKELPTKGNSYSYISYIESWLLGMTSQFESCFKTFFLLINFSRDVLNLFSFHSLTSDVTTMYK